MKCRYCGYEIPDGILYCGKCGREVQIVPDYNPLEDMLAAHVKDAINNTGRSAGQNSGRMPGRRAGQGSGRASGRMSGQNSGRVSGRASGQNSGRVSGRASGQNSGRVSGKTTARRSGSRISAGRTGGTTARGYYNTAGTRDDRELRRRQAERKRALKKKKRRKILLILILFLIILAGASAALYINSYAGIVRSGNKSLQAKEYSAAEQAFKKAIAKDNKKPDAYTGLSKVYIGQGDLDAAEDVFLDAIEKQPENADLYEAAFHFYLDTDQPMGIPELLSDAKEKVLEKLSEYVVKEPEFSLDDEEVYDDVQQLTLTSDAGSVYYTTDGSTPDPKSTKFQKPIQLEEGSNQIQAISVNKKGIPSQIVQREFVIELPVEDAPAVSPSTGQYDYAKSIEIKVPDGYTAYYTMDGTDPTTASDKYDGAIEMPKGETLFKAILVTKSGRVSGVTTRNYIRE